MRFLTEILAKAGITSNYFKLDTSATPPIEVGKVVWNAADGTFDMGLLNNVTLQAGQELHFYGKAVGAISNGQAVMFAGAQGDHALMTLADAATINANPEYFIGVATQDFANDDFGYVTVLGKVRGLNTSAYTAGDLLYYNSTSATDGLLTATMPSAPNAKILVAAVLRVHANEGILLVRPHTMPKISDIQDVSISSLANNDFFVYDSATSVWKNKTIAAALGYTPANDSNVVKLTGDQTVAGAKTFTSVINASTLSINGGTLVGNNIVSMRSNPTGGQFRIEKSDGSLSAYPFYVGVDGTALAYYYNASGALKVLLHTNDTSYLGNSLSVGYSTYASTSYMLDVNGTARFVGALTGTSATFTNPVTIGNYDGQALKLQSATSTGSSYLRFYNSAAASRGYLGLFWNGTSDYMVFDAGALEMNFGSSNKFTFTGGGTAIFSGAITANSDVTISTGSIKMYSVQNAPGQYRYIGTEYAAGNGNNKAEIRFGIDGSDTRTKITLHTANGGGQINEVLGAFASGQLKFNNYTASSSFSGTAAGYLAFDSSGNVITVAGVASTVTAGFSLTTQGAANNTPSTPSVNAGVYAGVYAFIDLATQNENGGWIDFSKGDGSDFAGRIRYYHNPDRFGFHTAGGVEKITFDAGGNIVLLGGSSSAQSSLASGLTSIRFPNQYSSGYTDAGVKLYIFNSGTTIQGFTAGPAYDLQYHSSGSDTGRHAFYVANSEVIRFNKTTVISSQNLAVGSQQGFDNPGGWNKNILIDATNHGRFRIKASNYTYGNIEVYLWADSSVSPSHGIYGSNAVFSFGGSITSLTVGGQTVIHTGNIGSQSVNYASTAGTASNISAYTINQSLGTGNTPSFQEAIFGTTGGANNQGIQIRYQNYVSGYGRIRFYQSDSNHATIHVFSSSWQNGTLAGSSTGAINLDSGTGVTFGAWNNPDAYVVTGGQTYARGYRGIGNVAGTGEASYHPAGIYSTGNNWLYGNIMMNGYSISGANTISGSGLITGGTLRSNTNIYTDQNYGYGLVGVYTSTRYQGVFAMGDSYKLPADGSTTGSLYGLAWSHPNAGGVAGNLNTHGLLVMENGTFLAAISGSIRARDNVMAPAIYDSGSRVAISRGEGRQYVEYSRYVYNNGAYSGSGWIEPSDLGVRYAASSNYSNSTGSLSGFDKTNPSFGQVFASDWFRAQGDCGLYSQSYGGHLRRSNGSSFGNWETFGYERNGWSGFCYVHNYLLNIMSNTSGDHGFYQENGNGWTLFYNRGNNCWGIGTDNTYSGDGFRCVKYGSSQYGWTTWSDRRAKENITSITGALDKVLNMRGVYFNYISDDAKTQRVGFIAQELEQVLPEAVRYAEEIDEYNVEYAQIVSVLTEAIKEQNVKITRLETLVEQLTNN